MRILLAIVLLCGSALAQLATMDQIPTIRQSNSSDVITASTALAYSRNVVMSNVLVAMFHTRANIATPTIADTQGSSWTLRITMGTTNTWVYVWTATAGGSGADTVTVTQSGGTTMKMAVLEIAHAAELIDVSATGATATNGSSQVVMPSVTTAHYRTLVLEILCGNWLTAGALANSSYSAAAIMNYYTLTRSTIYIQGSLSGDPGTAAGSTLQTQSALQASSQGVLAFRSAAALAVSTPSIPDAVRGEPYSFQLQAVDGVGTNVWSITSGSLPCGLSLATDGTISGTPSCSNGNTITFQVQDSAATTATANLTLQVANSRNTPAFIQSTSSGTGSVLINGVVAGHTLFFGIANTTNFAQSLFLTPLPTDNCGSTYAQIPGAVTTIYNGIYYMQFFLGTGGSGNCTITTNLSTATTWVEEWTNVQPIFDTGIVSLLNANTGANPILSGTLPVPTFGELLYSIAVPGTAGAAVTVNSPFTSATNYSAGSSAVRVQSAYEAGAASGTANASFPITGNSSNLSAIMIFGLRPTTTGTAPIASAKPRSQIY
jgi:hypothetical protein